MTVAVPVGAFAPASAWRAHEAALALAVLAIIALFWADAADLARIWWTSTTYGHCLFVPPVVGWLVWQRRRELAQLTPIAWWPGLLGVAAGGFAWLLGDAGGVALLRHLGLVVALQGAIVALLGPNVARALLFPLGYVLFAVPFGQDMEPPLQRVTVAIVMPLLDLVGVPARVDGVLIQAGRYWFEVAEACSGSKFVLAMLAFGTLVAGTCFHSWRRRAAFMLACVVVPVLANGVRAFGTIWAAELTSIEAAAGFDHIVFGWVFFALVMAGVLALAWPWFDRAPDEPAFDPAQLQGPVRHRLDLLPAALLVVATGAAAPAWSVAIGGRAQSLPSRIYLPDLPGWTRASLSRTAAWEPRYLGADHRLLGRYVDGRGRAVDMAVAVYGVQEEGRELVAFGVGIDERWRRVADEAPVAGGSVTRITAPGPVERTVATWYRVGGVTTADPARVKFETARARLLGARQGAAALHLSAEGRQARETIEAFARDLGDLDRAIDRTAGLD
ncbi:exosortase A [Sphingomonas lenta]|uniref:exosortase A n=1 Tax=Sphingomonas lenta TaxID=1141887 RepID=UPI001FECA50C|nr:exosortase A [Sphingomonas lenta]